MNLTKSYLSNFIIIILFIMISTPVYSQSGSTATQYEVGKSYHGFKLLQKEFVKEVNADCYYFEHEKSGAKLFKIAADDPNKTFCIAFKTIPESDYGTPHIMEHSVLNGSKNFPVKSPFDILAKGSLNTFLNAMTGSDVTMYPVASMNDKDYFNLMHVYLDAVFYPLIYSDPKIFMQEGWHYELTSPDAPLVYKGVVYNEMKGAFSSPTRELFYQTTKNLFPDNGYGFSSGGYPSAIPKLTYEAFLSFHKKNYHPSNSYIYLYGNADLDKELAFIDSVYLSKFDKQDVQINITLQKPFKQMKEVTAYYPVTEGDKTENQTYLSLSFVAGLNTNLALTTALNVICDVLVNQESAPIRLAMQKAGIGQDIYAYVNDTEQNVVQIVVQKANPADKSKFYDILISELKKASETGLDKKAVEGTFNRYEFSLREGNDAQKGLTYAGRLLGGWFFANDPYMGLEYEKPIAEVKSMLGSGYIEKIIKQDMIDNPHSLLLVLEPKPGLENENNEKMQAELEKFKESLSPKQIDSLVQVTKDLMNYQKREDTPEALAKIPLLELKDINPESQWYNLKKEEIEHVPLLYHEEFTNNVVYTNLYFDEKVLPKELIPYSSLLAEVLGSLSTANYSYGDLDKELNIHTGGFSTHLNSYLENQLDKNLDSKFVVSSKALNNKTEKMFGLISEIISKTKYADKDRLKTVLARHQAQLDSQVKQNGFGVAMTRVSSYFSKEGLFNEMTSGLDYYHFITKLNNDFDSSYENIANMLIQTAKLLFTKENMTASITCANEDLPNFTENLGEFIKALPDTKPEYSQWDLKPEKKNEGILSASKVQYVLEGFNFKDMGYEYNGKMLVLNQILSREYLQNKLRVLGGAYGGFSSFSNSGQVVFASYRDPNLKETLDNYDSIPGYLETFNADDQEMTRFIIGTIARIDHPLTPSQKGDVAFTRYFEKVTRNDVQKIRDEVLSTTPQDIRNMKKLVEDILSKKTYCVYGNEDKINSVKEIFNNVVKLSD
jgi:presequence protease